MALAAPWFVPFRGFVALSSRAAAVGRPGLETRPCKSPVGRNASGGGSTAQIAADIDADVSGGGRNAAVVDDALVLTREEMPLPDGLTENGLRKNWVPR